MTRAFLIPYTFTLLNWAAVVGLYHFVHRTSLTEIWPEQHIPVELRNLG